MSDKKTGLCSGAFDQVTQSRIQVEESNSRCTSCCTWVENREIAVYARQNDRLLSKHVRATVIANVRISGFENRRALTGFVSSHLTLSANIIRYWLWRSVKYEE